MSPLQRRNQARKNGAKAAGSKSPEGLKKSSLNATKHGLSAKAHVLANESQEDYDQLRREYFNRFQPQDTIELDILDDMVGARWRLRRIAAIQTARIEIQMERYTSQNQQEAKTLDAAGLQAMAFGRMVVIENSMQMLLRYEATYNRIYDRAIKALQALQHDRQNQTEEELQNDPESPEHQPQPPLTGHPQLQKPEPDPPQPPRGGAQ